MKPENKVQIELTGMEAALLYTMLKEGVEQLALLALAQPLKAAREEVQGILSTYVSIRNKLEDVGADNIEE